jgi:putative transposase
LKDADIRNSMDDRGRWMDNVFIQRLWRSLKYECVFLSTFETGSGARIGIGRGIGSQRRSTPLGLRRQDARRRYATRANEQIGGVVKP